MKKFSLFLIFLTLSFLFATSLVFAQSNSYLSDYNFQLDQYRKNYAEYQNFKSDYEKHPTLDNEQKAILAAKQTIISRELAWANFVLSLSSSINTSRVSYPFINKVISDLTTLSEYHFGQAKEAEGITNRDGLTAFTKKSSSAVASHRLLLAKAQVANKLAQMIRFQLDAKMDYDSLLPKLEPVKDEIVVQNGQNQIETYGKQINDQIASVVEETEKLQASLDSYDQFLSTVSETLSKIRSLQSRLVGIIIDLDVNYVHQ